MTTEMLGKIKELNEQGLNDSAIAEQLHYSTTTVHYWRRWLGLPTTRINRTKKLYTVYDGVTTQFLIEGTAKECAAYMGVNVTRFYQIKCKFDDGAYKKYEIYEVTD